VGIEVEDVIFILNQLSTMDPQRLWDNLKMSLTAHHQNVKIMFDVEFQTSFIVTLPITT